MSDKPASEKYAEWINADVGATETFDRERHIRFDATFDREHDRSSRHIAPMSHLIHFQSDVPLSKLGPDGHAEHGGEPEPGSPRVVVQPVHDPTLQGAQRARVRRRAAHRPSSWLTVSGIPNVAERFCSVIVWSSRPAATTRP